MREEVVVLEHHGAAVPQRGRARRLATGAEKSTVDVGADGDPAGVGHLEPVEAAQHRRLARPGRADQRDHLAAADAQVDALQHLVVPERLAQPA